MKIANKFGTDIEVTEWPGAVDVLLERLSYLERAFDLVSTRTKKDLIYLDEKIDNLMNYLSVLENKMVDFEEQVPSENMQWTEERLRALELQIKELRNGKSNES